MVFFPVKNSSRILKGLARQGHDIFFIFLALLGMKSLCTLRPGKGVDLQLMKK